MSGGASGVRGGAEPPGARQLRLLAPCDLQHFKMYGKMGEAHALCANIVKASAMSPAVAEELVTAMQLWLRTAASDPPKWMDFIVTNIQLLEDACKAHPIVAELASEFLVESFVELACQTGVKELINSDIVWMFNNCLGHSPRATRSSVFQKKTNIFRDVALLLAGCGEYELQMQLLELIVRYAPKSQAERAEHCRAVFPPAQYSEEIFRLFCETTFVQFDVDCRTFLQPVNDASGLVLSFLCQSIHSGEIQLIDTSGVKDQLMWLNLNVRGRSIGLLFNGESVQRNTYLTIDRYYLNRYQPMRIDASDITSVKMYKRLGVVTIDVRGKGTSLIMDPSPSSFLRIVPAPDAPLKKIEAGLTKMFQTTDKYTCNIVLDEYAEGRGSPAAYINTNSRIFSSEDELAKDRQGRGCVTITESNNGHKRRHKMILAMDVNVRPTTSGVTSPSSTSTTSMHNLRNTILDQCKKKGDNVFNNKSNKKNEYKKHVPVLSEFKEVNRSKTSYHAEQEEVNALESLMTSIHFDDFSKSFEHPERAEEVRQITDDLMSEALKTKITGIIPTTSDNTNINIAPANVVSQRNESSDVISDTQKEDDKYQNCSLQIFNMRVKRKIQKGHKYSTDDSDSVIEPTNRGLERSTEIIMHRSVVQETQEQNAPITKLTSKHNEITKLQPSLTVPASRNPEESQFDSLLDLNENTEVRISSLDARRNNETDSEVDDILNEEKSPNVSPKRLENILTTNGTEIPENLIQQIKLPNKNSKNARLQANLNLEQQNAIIKQTQLDTTPQVLINMLPGFDMKQVIGQKDTIFRNVKEIDIRSEVKFQTMLETEEQAQGEIIPELNNDRSEILPMSVLSTNNNELDLNLTNLYNKERTIGERPQKKVDKENKNKKISLEKSAVVIIQKVNMDNLEKGKTRLMKINQAKDKLNHTGKNISVTDLQEDDRENTPTYQAKDTLKIRWDKQVRSHKTPNKGNSTDSELTTVPSDKTFKIKPIELNDQDDFDLSNTNKRRKTFNRKISSSSTDRGHETSEENRPTTTTSTDADTPVPPTRKRRLYSPNVHNDIENFLEEVQPTETRKSSIDYYKEIKKENAAIQSQKKTRNSRRLKLNTNLRKSLTPKSKKYNDLFDQLRSTDSLGVESHHILAQKFNGITEKIKDGDMAIYNMSTDSEDDFQLGTYKKMGIHSADSTGLSAKKEQIFDKSFKNKAGKKKKQTKPKRPNKRKVTAKTKDVRNVVMENSTTSNIFKELPILEDERMREVEPVNDTLNTSIVNEIVHVNVDILDKVPPKENLQVEMEPIPIETDVEVDSTKKRVKRIKKKTKVPTKNIQADFSKTRKNKTKIKKECANVKDKLPLRTASDNLNYTLPSLEIEVEQHKDADPVSSILKDPSKFCELLENKSREILVNKSVQQILPEPWKENNTSGPIKIQVREPTICEDELIRDIRELSQKANDIDDIEEFTIDVHDLEKENSPALPEKTNTKNHQRKTLQEHSAYSNQSQNVKSSVIDVMTEKTSLEINAKHPIRIDSSYESEKSFQTNKTKSPINAHGDMNESPPGVDLLDNSEPPRDLLTENLSPTSRKIMKDFLLVLETTPFKTFNKHPTKATKRVQVVSDVGSDFEGFSSDDENKKNCDKVSDFEWFTSEKVAKQKTKLKRNNNNNTFNRHKRTQFKSFNRHLTKATKRVQVVSDVESDFEGFDSDEENTKNCDKGACFEGFITCEKVAKQKTKVIPTNTFKRHKRDDTDIFFNVGNDKESGNGIGSSPVNVSKITEKAKKRPAKPIDQVIVLDADECSESDDEIDNSAVNVPVRAKTPTITHNIHPVKAKKTLPKRQSHPPKNYKSYENSDSEILTEITQEQPSRKQTPAFKRGDLYFEEQPILHSSKYNLRSISNTISQASTSKVTRVNPKIIKDSVIAETDARQRVTNAFKEHSFGNVSTSTKVDDEDVLNWPELPFMLPSPLKKKRDKEKSHDKNKHLVTWIDNSSKQGSTELTVDDFVNNAIQMIEAHTSNAAQSSGDMLAGILASLAEITQAQNDYTSHIARMYEKSQFEHKAFVDGVEKLKRLVKEKIQKDHSQRVLMVQLMKEDLKMLLQKKYK